jgi:hypothetical protein
LIQKQITVDPWIDLTQEEIEADAAERAAQAAALQTAKDALERVTKNAAKPFNPIDPPPSLN